MDTLEGLCYPWDDITAVTGLVLRWKGWRVRGSAGSKIVGACKRLVTLEGRSLVLTVHQWSHYCCIVVGSASTRTECHFHRLDPITLLLEDVVAKGQEVHFEKIVAFVWDISKVNCGETIYCGKCCFSFL